jgi:hypothetical protein
MRCYMDGANNTERNIISVFRAKFTCIELIWRGNFSPNSSVQFYRIHDVTSPKVAYLVLL